MIGCTSVVFVVYDIFGRIHRCASHQLHLLTPRTLLFAPLPSLTAYEIRNSRRLCSPPGFPRHHPAGAPSSSQRCRRMPTKPRSSRRCGPPTRSPRSCTTVRSGATQGRLSACALYVRARRPSPRVPSIRPLCDSRPPQLSNPAEVLKPCEAIVGGLDALYSTDLSDDQRGIVAVISGGADQIIALVRIWAGRVGGGDGMSPRTSTVAVIIARYGDRADKNTLPECFRVARRRLRTASRPTAQALASSSWKRGLPTSGASTRGSEGSRLLA